MVPMCSQLKGFQVVFERSAPGRSFEAMVLEAIAGKPGAWPKKRTQLDLPHDSIAVAERADALLR